jgi:acylphosphatase
LDAGKAVKRRFKSLASLAQPSAQPLRCFAGFAKPTLLQFILSQMNRNENQARRFFVAGRVQGVGYRYFVQELAQELGLRGYVRNLRDGRVEVLALGSPETLRLVRQALQKGPMMSRVAEVIEEPATLEPRYDKDFTVEMTA